jgi:hypothetical protein
MTQSIVKAFESDAVKDAGIFLTRLEIGNEPDIYQYTGHRDAPYTLEEYVQE